MNDDSFYNIPIQTLGLSANTIALLGRVGITNVGDCVDFYQRGSAATIQVPYGLIDAFFTEIVPRLREFGYIPDEEDSNS